MNDINTSEKPFKPLYKWFLIIFIFATTLIMLYLVYIYPEKRIGAMQPIPFSHRLHVTDKEIDCKYCHSYVDRSPYPGMPPVALCISCHKYIIPQHPEIQKLHRYYDEKKPIQWKRIFFQPDFVFFNHKRHIVLGVECKTCHGNIEQMDRVTQTFQTKMEFCVTCHRQNNASVECYVCHH